MLRLQALLSERKIWELFSDRSNYIYDFSINSALPNYARLSDKYPEIKFFRGRSNLCNVYLPLLCKGCPLNCLNVWTESNYSYYTNWTKAKSLKAKLNAARNILKLIDKELDKEYSLTIDKVTKEKDEADSRK